MSDASDARIKALVNALTLKLSEAIENNNDIEIKNIEQKLLKIQNEGVQLFTFLGHGSLSVLDVPIGSINQLQNTNKPAVYYLNGCAIGNPASLSPQGTGSIYANDYLCANQKGAIAWLAHSNITLNTPLFLQMEKM
jgi:hypothetical protein